MSASTSIACRRGKTLARDTGDREACLVVLTGDVTVKTGAVQAEHFGGRRSVFDGPPSSVYVPAKSRWAISAETDVELAVCTAPAEGKLPARLIPPGEVGHETRGKDTNTRYIRNILPDSTPHAEKLLVVEVITPGGHWSSYPPHKHDTSGQTETALEETYYHRLRRGSGFAFQRVYTDDRSLDETMAVQDNDVVLVPRGYHPVGAPHGFDLYYLNTMAGPVRKWQFTMAPEHAFLTF